METVDNSLTLPHVGSAEAPAPHPRTIGWVGTTALAMGGANQSLFLVGALIASQGSAAVPLLIIGLLLSWAATPGWTELIMMWPNRVGGIAATCAEAFRPYSPVLANLTGVCYWWGWIPTCGLTAILSASALHVWYVPFIPIKVLAVAIVLAFVGINLCGIKWVTRVAVPIATVSATLALLSGLIPILSGNVDWTQATSFDLLTPFDGVFGQITSAMAGIYLIGFAAPAFEAAACHVGETIEPEKNVPRAMFASAGMATVYFVFLPIVWLGVIGAGGIGGDLAQTLGPTFAPLFGEGAKAAAIWFMVFNMFHGTMQPLAGAARTMSQLSEDGLLPRSFAKRSRTDMPWVATSLTAGMAILFLLTGDPTWVIAAANLTYLIGICLPSVAVFLLRRNEPQMARPYRAPRGTIVLGVLAACAWGVSTVLGFEQYGLPTVLAGIALAYAGAALYAYRRWTDRRRDNQPRVPRSLHLKLTGAMLAVLVLDGAGYLLAVTTVDHPDKQLVTVLSDIFVAVALLTITVGLVLPGMIAHAATEMAEAAQRLTLGTIADFTRAMEALGDGSLDQATANVDKDRVRIRTRDEIGLLAEKFNEMHDEVARAAISLDHARERLVDARAQLEASNEKLQHWSAELERRVEQRTADLVSTQEQLLQSQRMEAMGKLAGGVAHDFNNLMTAVAGYSSLLLDRFPDDEQARHDLLEVQRAVSRGAELTQQLLTFSRRRALKAQVTDLNVVVSETEGMLSRLMGEIDLVTRLDPDLPLVDVDRVVMGQALVNLVVNARDASGHGGTVVVETAGPASANGHGREDGEFVTLSVTDSGVGMDAATRERCFEPFFTTKDPGKGTGLGLSTVYGITEQSGGHVTVTSELGQGSCFTIHLPVSSAPPTPVLPTPTPMSRSRGHERVLIVDDDAAIRRMLEKALALDGYDTLIAADGAEALALLREHDIDLLVSDVIMPGLNGRELAERAQATHPGLRVLLISGYTGDAISERGLVDESTAFLPKPFTTTALSRAVREAIDAAARA